MMNKKKLLSTICAAALTVSVVGGSIVSAAAADRDANILKGKVTDIEETTITLELAPVGAPDQKNDGAALLPAAKPDGDIQDDLTPPEKPEGEEQNDLTSPEKPADDQKQPPEKKSVEVDVADAAITEDGQAAAAEDIEVGDMLTVELDEDGNAVSVTIDDLPAPKDDAIPDEKPIPDDGLDPSEKPDPVDGDFAPEEKPLPDEAFDPADKPAFDEDLVPDDQGVPSGEPVPGIQGVANVRPAENAPRDDRFGGRMMPLPFDAELDETAA